MGGDIGLDDLFRMGDHNKSRFEAEDDFRGPLSTIRRSDSHYYDRNDRDDRRDARPRGARQNGSSRASSIEGLPKAENSGIHPLHHPYTHSGNFPQRSVEIFQGPDF